MRGLVLKAVVVRLVKSLEGGGLRLAVGIRAGRREVLGLIQLCAFSINCMIFRVTVGKERLDIFGDYGF